ncbi:MAG: hypothetical protein ABSH32_33860, partial [Bryobacteraceae bacterium]
VKASRRQRLRGPRYLKGNSTHKPAQRLRWGTSERRHTFSRRLCKGQPTGAHRRRAGSPSTTSGV